MVARGTLIAVAVVTAFWSTVVEIAEDITQGSHLGYLLLMPVLAGFAAIGIALRRGGELPIHDRQTDIIVGLIVLALSMAVVGLLVRRYRYHYELLHLDVLAAWLFLLSACVLVFGLRPTCRFWPVWLLLLAAAPLPYGLAIAALGGGVVASGLVMLLIAAVTAAIATGRTPARGCAAAAIALVVGGLCLLAVRSVLPDGRGILYQALPSVIGVSTACAVMYLYQRRGAALEPLDRPLAALTAGQSYGALALVVSGAVVLGLIPVYKDYSVEFPEVAGLVVMGQHLVPPGWQLLSEDEYPWARRYLGSDATLTRQLIRAERGNSDWDKESRRRRIVVDTARGDDPYSINNVPEFVLYRLQQPRISPPSYIDLGRGVTARLNVVLDDRRLLSWTWLSWNWTGTGGAERITLIAADNHLPDAEFPPLQPAFTEYLDNLMNQLFRGNAVVLDSHSHAVEADLAPKDEDLLTTVARAMVRARTS
ncbi:MULTISPECIES: hypothetical protein [unclassified Nocardia]|uniref:hypothetical protein n=1 Tax=unclassified Nocardia TaxID=2637762 RepID=UPI0024A8F891|nr:MULTISPECIES: hypothetical protein [unclassified Nocardia]